MSIFSKLKSKLNGIDPAFEEVKSEQIGLYQHYFDKVINSIDLVTQTNWSQSKEYDRQQMNLDEEVMEKIIAVDAAHEGLSPAILQIMVNQYFFADVYQREIDRDNWVKRVMYRKNEDYFPSGWAVFSLLQKVSN